MKGTGFPTPVPERLTDCGLSNALSVRVNPPVRTPKVVGVNVALILQLAPMATEMPQGAARSAAGRSSRSANRHGHRLTLTAPAWQHAREAAGIAAGCDHEQIVGRLSLEPHITAASWEVEQQIAEA